MLPTLSTSPTMLRARENIAVHDRIARSAATTQGVSLPTEDIPGWLAERRSAHRFRVEPIPFADLDLWSFDPETGNLAHRSGKFFTVEGLDVVAGSGNRRHWQQPIIVQPEVGILGLLAKDFGGVLHFLMQAKMEPGNPNVMQLSPTVQATRSNYTKVHQGSAVAYLNYFLEPARGRVIVDVLQSEQGAWFLHKSNRNMIVEVIEDVPLGADFCWLALGQIAELLHQDNVVNMDARTVLACAPMAHTDEALHSDIDLLSWFTTERSRLDLRVQRMPLALVSGWTRGADAIEGGDFRVVAVAVEAGSREVTRWTQPLIEPLGRGLCALLSRHIEGVPHLLVRARAEAGFLDSVELGPTVQCMSGDLARASLAGDEHFLSLVLSADPAKIRYAAVHAEEGGRFRNAENRYLVLEVDDADVPLEAPPGYCWVTPGQLTTLVRHGHYVNVQARTLLACVNAMSAGR